MKAQLKDIIPGRILYYVSCINGLDKNATLSCKVIVTSKPIEKFGAHSKLLIGQCFNSIDDYRINHFDWVNENSHHFLGDLGMDKSKPRYNLHGLFTSKDSALDYVEQCNRCVFIEPRDQEYYNKTSTDEFANRKASQDLADWAFEALFGGE